MIIDFINDMIKIYEPAEAFVIDVCLLLNGEMKIVEINCFNSSGFYDADIQKIVMSIEDNF